jgi:hypothetical protein
MKVTYKVEGKKLCEIQKGELFLDGSGDLHIKANHVMDSQNKLLNCAVNLVTYKAVIFDSEESFRVVNAEMTVEEFV